MQTQMNNLATLNQRLESMLGNFIKMNTASSSGTGSLPSNIVANPKGELKHYPRSGLLFLMNFSSYASYHSYIRRWDERVEEIFTDLEHGEFTIKVPPPLVQKAKQRNFVIHQRDPLKIAQRFPNGQKLLEKLDDPGDISQFRFRDRDLFATNHPSGNPTSSLTSHTNLTSPEVNDDIFDPEEDIIENLLNLDKTKDLPPYHDNQLSGNPTLISKPETKSSSFSPTLISLEESELIWKNSSLSRKDYFLREVRDELAHITFPPGNDDLPFDAESDLLELEYLLNHDPIKDMDSILEDSVDENSLDDNLDDTISEMFTNEHALDYIHHLWMIMMMTLFDQLSDFLPFPNRDLVFYEDFSKVDALPSTNNEDKVFNPGILIHENLFEATNFATPDKNVKKTTNASLILEDFNPPLYELPFHKEAPGLGALLFFPS
ncbi:hypothetical protein Tco_0632495 [Tanacetum coccineum]